MKRLFMYSLLFTLALAAPRNTYKGWKLYRFWPPTEGLVQAFSMLYENTENFDFWSTIREPNQPVDLAVAEVAHPSFENLLRKLNVTDEVQIESVDKALNRESREMKAAPNPKEGDINFLKYHRYDVIMSYIDNLAKKYSDTVSVESIGKSVEEREIKIVKISVGVDNLKPAILITAALSPREWIGPAQALYIIKELVENSDNRDLIKNVDWYIIPLVNPDGYEYTHTTERLWKKSLSKNQNGDYGVYLNRNFDVDFGSKLSSSAEDAWNYHGPSAFSEPETRALKKFIEEKSSQIKLYLNLHSFGPTVLYPYGFTNDPPKNMQKIKSIAKKAASRLEKMTGTSYRAKSASSKNYEFSGSSVDWVIAKTHIPYAYTIELPSAGYLGFDFPAHRIEGVVKEFMVGLNVFHNFVRDNFSVKSKKDEL